MCTPLEGQKTDVNVRTSHRLLGLHDPELGQAPHCLPCEKTEQDIEFLSGQGHWTVVNLTFVQMLMGEFAMGRTVQGFVCENAFGTGLIVLRSPLKEDGVSIFDKRVVEIILMPLKDGFIAAAAYQRFLGEIDQNLAKMIQDRINCWRRNLPASTPTRGDAYRNWMH